MLTTRYGNMHNDCKPKIGFKAMTCCSPAPNPRSPVAPEPQNSLLPCSLRLAGCALQADVPRTWATLYLPMTHADPEHALPTRVLAYADFPRICAMATSARARSNTARMMVYSLMTGPVSACGLSTRAMHRMALKGMSITGRLMMSQ